MKITMIGTSKSGKTTFAAGVYKRLMAQEIGGFKIVPRADNFSEQLLSTHKFAQDFRSLANRSWPKGTTETTYWTLNLNYKGKHVTYFDWIDYRGGFLDDPVLDPVQAQEVHANIVASDAVILFADSFQLTKFRDIDEASYNAGIDTIKQLLETFSQRYTGSRLTFVVALTKCDSIHKIWKENEYKHLLERATEAFDSLRATLQRELWWQGGIVPISAVGEGATQLDGNGDFNLVGFPHPHNIEHVLFFCIGGAMTANSYSLIDNFIETEDKKRILEEKEKGLTAILRHTMNKLRGTKSNRDIIEELRNEQQKDIQALREIRGAVEPLHKLALTKVRRFP